MFFKWTGGIRMARGFKNPKNNKNINFLCVLLLLKKIKNKNMSNTVTARRNRFEFYLSKLQDTTMYIQQLIKTLYNKNKDESRTARQNILIFRDDVEIQERFRTAITQKYPHFNKVFNVCVGAYMQLMYIDDNTIRINSNKCPTLFVFGDILQLYYSMPVLLQEDDKFGTFFFKFKQYWNDIVRNFIDINDTSSLPLTKENLHMQTSNDKPGDTSSTILDEENIENVFADTTKIFQQPMKFSA